MSFLVSLILLTSADPVVDTAAVADPLAMMAGKVECANPDRAKRNCESIGDFYVDAAGRTIGRSRGVIERGTPPLTMTSLFVAEQRGDALCFAISAEAVAATRFDRGGRSDDGAAAAQRRNQMADILRPYFGRSLCERYVPADAPVKAEVSVDGVREPQHDRSVLWVDVDAGWQFRVPE